MSLRLPRGPLETEIWWFTFLPKDYTEQQRRMAMKFGFALDRVMTDGAKLTATLGRHTNDHMISFYALTPPGIEIEFGFGARTVDDATWQTALHHKQSIWGHKRS